MSMCKTESENPFLSIGWRFEHFREESVDGSVANQPEEEEVLEALETYGSERREAEEEFGEPARLGRVGVPRVFFQDGVDFLAEKFHLLDWFEPTDVGVEEDDATQTAQLRFVHFHFAHFRDEFC